MKLHHPCSFVLLFAPLFASACHDSSSGGGSVQTAQFDHTTAKRWFDQVTAAIDAENLNPPEASRRIGYAAVAFYEGVVGGMPDHRSLAGQLNGLGSLPAFTPGRQHWPAVANAAVADVLAHVFATASAPTLQAIADLETTLASEFATTVDAATLDRSAMDGEALAAALIDWIDADGYAQWDNCAFTPPTGDGVWVPTPPGFANPLEPCWGNLRPFVLLFGAECAPLPHPPFSRIAGSAFAVEGQEVYDTVNALTAEQMDIALFWADGGGTLTPPGHWVSITGQILAQEGPSLDVAAEAYAKVGLAVADAFICCWEIKFTYNLLRPITYIQDPTGPINDPAWTSPIATPPFAEFTSGHSTQSSAAAMVLTDLFGDVAFTDHTHDGAGLAARSFTSFIEAADEAAISRLYGGIHYRAAIERGLEQGRCIGRTILRNVEFRQ
jgi:hypothetical protein